MSIGSFPAADFTPQLVGYTGQGAFRFWCQKVLPIVYDDSLSYYELLNKVVIYLNNTISDVSNVESNLGELYSAYVKLQDYVNNYFSSLDVQEEINNKIDEMVDNGTFSALLSAVSQSYFEKMGVYVNVGGYVDDLNSDNIVEAIGLALADSPFIYIPAGNYNFHATINQDCEIKLDPNCVIETSTKEPCFLFENCSFKLSGGYAEAGELIEDRRFVYDPADWADYYTTTDKDRRHGIIEVRNCQFCEISGLKSRISQYPAVIRVFESSNVTIKDCSFRNCMYSAIMHINSGNNLRYENIFIENVRAAYTDDYCYGITLGANVVAADGNPLPENGFEPPENVVFTRCTVINSEDSGLDSHGSSNTVFECNTILECTCSITAYNDCRRVYRPDWQMTGTIIRNNYCKSHRTGVFYGNNDTPHVRHPFVLLGGANPNGFSGAYEVVDGETVEVANKGNYYQFNGCLVENNYFWTNSGYGCYPTANYPRVISFNEVSRNMTIVNNYIYIAFPGYTRPGETNIRHQLPFRIARTFNFVIRGNVIENCKANYLLLGFCRGEIKDNIGLRLVTDGTNMCLVDGLGAESVEDGAPNMLRANTLFLREGVSNICTSYGARVIDVDALHADSKNISIVVSNGIASCDHYRLIPGCSVHFEGVNGSTSLNGVVVDCVDFQHFRVARPNNTEIPDGEYVVTPLQAEFHPVFNDEPGWQTKFVGRVSFYKDPTYASEVLFMFPAGRTPVLANMDYTITANEEGGTASRILRKVMCLTDIQVGVEGGNPVYNQGMQVGYVLGRYILDSWDS